VVVGILSIAGLALLLTLLGREPAHDRPIATPRTLTPTEEPIAASVVIDNDTRSITTSFWQEAILLDQVLSGLAGQVAPTPEETLQRLINEELVLQATSSVQRPTQEQIQERIRTLERAWGVNDTAVREALETVGLAPSTLDQAVGRLLRVEAGLDLLRSQGHDAAEWLEEQRASAQIQIIGTATALSIPTPQSPIPTAPISPLPAPTTKSPLPSPSPAPVTVTPVPTAPLEIPDVAPDFTLNRSGGGTLTLSEQLRHGPVVLVFFSRGGG
jgi:hypothetical protein